MPFEIITNPASTVGTVVIALISVTAAAFVVIVFLCGLSPKELLEIEAEEERNQRNKRRGL